MQTALTLRRWQRADYDRLVELGVFHGEPFGWRYRSVARLVPPAAVVPLALGGRPIAVADLLL